MDKYLIHPNETLVHGGPHLLSCVRGLVLHRFQGVDDSVSDEPSARQQLWSPVDKYLMVTNVFWIGPKFLLLWFPLFLVSWIGLALLALWLHKVRRRAELTFVCRRPIMSLSI